MNHYRKYDHDQTEKKKRTSMRSITLEGLLNDRSSSFGIVYKNKNRLMVIDTMKCAVLLLTNIIVVMKNFDSIAGTDVSNGCSGQQYSPLCFCRATYDLFLARLILFQCKNSLPIRHCCQSQFNPPSFHLTQLIPQVMNLSHCLEDVHCLHTLNSRQHCRQCQLTDNDSSHTETCFNFCEQNPSCGIVCLNQSVMISINCSQCHGRHSNISCQ